MAPARDRGRTPPPARGRLLLGSTVGWAGAQNILGSVATTHVVVPVLPVPYLAALTVASGALTVAAAVVPVRVRLAEEPITPYRTV